VCVCVCVCVGSAILAMHAGHDKGAPSVLANEVDGVVRYLHVLWKREAFLDTRQTRTLAGGHTPIRTRPSVSR
jgi:hypothetical protein